MIGDTERDLQAGQNAGCKESIMVETNAPEGLLRAVRELKLDY
jgi:mannose-1-phosphate guanylyltransferase/phosphomannomutase